MTEDLFAAARRCLDAAAPDAKVSLTFTTAEAWEAGRLAPESDLAPAPIAEPGRPPRPRLVAPGAVPRRSARSAEGRAALIHAITHIEFNAINLAWDAVYRFRAMPRAYYDDWVGVAAEEANHFGLLRRRLAELGHEYGDFDAHDGLWEMARNTSRDVLVRMALVPRVLEARGLDVTPGMMERLRQAGDPRTVSILELILREEVGHVAVGSRWFRFACRQRGLDPEPTFLDLLQRYMKGRIKGPFHEAARSAAGFTDTELTELKRQAGVDRE
ncbi:MAG: ferritin-like domain-containing protein [Gammaproteobacteria bacterium]